MKSHVRSGDAKEAAKEIQEIKASLSAFMTKAYLKGILDPDDAEILEIGLRALAGRAEKIERAAAERARLE